MAKHNIMALAIIILIGAIPTISVASDDLAPEDNKATPGGTAVVSACPKDADCDGVTDDEENRRGTMIKVCDSDNDGLSDGIEIGRIQPKTINGCHGLQPSGTNFKRPTVLDPLNPDSDGDGLPDGEEDANGNGWLDAEESDPSIIDTDSDGISDGTEALGDFDDDGFPDYDYTLIKAGQKCTPPADIADIDCDGVPNARDTDSDNDGCPDKTEGGWLDANSNNIPDIFDNQSKTCQSDSVPSPPGSSKPSGSASDDEGSATQNPLFSNLTDTGPACSLVSRNGDQVIGLSKVFLNLTLLCAAILIIIYVRRANLALSD